MMAQTGFLDEGTARNRDVYFSNIRHARIQTKQDRVDGQLKARTKEGRNREQSGAAKSIKRHGAWDDARRGFK